MIYDVREKDQDITQIAWCNNEKYDLTKFAMNGGIKVRACDLQDLKTAQNLIKALQKAIELGWVT